MKFDIGKDSCDYYLSRDDYVYHIVKNYKNFDPFKIDKLAKSAPNMRRLFVEHLNSNFESFNFDFFNRFKKAESFKYTFLKDD